MPEQIGPVGPAPDTRSEGSESAPRTDIAPVVRLVASALKDLGSITGEQYDQAIRTIEENVDGKGADTALFEISRILEEKAEQARTQ